MATGVLGLAPKKDEVATYSATQAQVLTPTAVHMNAGQEIPQRSEYESIDIARSWIGGVHIGAYPTDVVSGGYGSTGPRNGYWVCRWPQSAFVAQKNRSAKN